MHFLEEVSVNGIGAFLMEVWLSRIRVRTKKGKRGGMKTFSVLLFSEQSD